MKATIITILTYTVLNIIVCNTDCSDTVKLICLIVSIIPCYGYFLYAFNRSIKNL